MSHAQGKIAVRRLDQEMVVVFHQAVRVADPMVTFIDRLKGIQKVGPVLVVFENSFLLIAA
jgi:hypothetical protein